MDAPDRHACDVVGPLLCILRCQVASAPSCTATRWSSLAETAAPLRCQHPLSVIWKPACGGGCFDPVSVGAGSLLGEVDRATQDHGLATILGLVSTTGVAGLTLGGGFSYLTRQFGWTVDNLLEVDIVTADAQVRTANRHLNEDLFWIGELPYVQQQSLFDADLPPGLAYHERSEYLPARLTDAFLRTFRDNALRVSTPVSETVLLHIGGALNQHAEHDGAVGNRDAHYVTWCAAASDNPDSLDVDWVEKSWAAVRPFSTGGNYLNFHSQEDNRQRTRDAYRGNYQRLLHLKQTYDPNNTLRVNRNLRA